MKWSRAVVMVLALAVQLVLAFGVQMGCSSGGGGSSSPPPSASWGKFRHDIGNTGQGIGGVVKNAGGTPTPVAILWSTNIDTSKISASPAVGLDNVIFIGTEGTATKGGTLAALNSSDGSNAWPSYVNTCDACAPDSLELGSLISSPAVYTVNSQTSIFVGSKNGALFGFQFTGNNLPTCVFCFRPTGGDATQTASFLSSPNFTVNPITLNVSGIFIGATITDVGGGKSGKLYALNLDGTVKWVYPKPTPIGTPTPMPGPGTPTPTARATLGPISSSPAIGFGSNVYFTTDDGFLYALTASGDLLWKTELASGADLLLAPSPVVNLTAVIASSADGVILALNADGSFGWGLDAPGNDAGDGFAGSLAVGFPASTPTPTPGIDTPTPATPTLTPVPGMSLMTVVAVRSSGDISLIDAATGKPLPPYPLATIAKPVQSSPALSADGYIVIGDHAGVLHAISTVDGSEPASWPIVLVPNAGGIPQPIRSSPALDGNGVAYVGSDDGYLYAVGTQ